MRASILALLLLLPSCAPTEETRSARAPTRQQLLTPVSEDSPEPAPPPAMLQGARGKNGTGKEHVAQFAPPPAAARPASPPPPRPAPPPRRNPPVPPLILRP